MADAAGEAQAIRFAQRVGFVIATGNGDAHLKNWSFAWGSADRPVLSPCYDFVSTITWSEQLGWKRRHGPELGLGLGRVRHFVTNVRAIEVPGEPDCVDELAEAGGLRAHVIAVVRVAGALAEAGQVEHHRAHLGSALFASEFTEAAVLSLDGFGDFVSTMWGRGQGSRIEVLGEVRFPHSLGILYTAVTQWLGFPKYGDEGKVMGLSAYGEPRLLPLLRRLIHLHDDGGFSLDLRELVAVAPARALRRGH